MFDSLGASPLFLKESLLKFRGTCHFNETPFQAKESVACGEFCLYFIIQRYFNEDLDLQELLEEYFSSNFNENEKRVKQFVSNI